MWYLCGLGSNIQPEQNLPRAIGLLADRYGPVWLSAVVRTRPEGIDTPHAFLNAIAVFATDLSPEQLKRELNTLEESLGRDRSDPLSSRKDRPIDVDILEVGPTRNFTGNGIEEHYYRALFEGGPPQPAVPLELSGQLLGQAPATVYRNQGAGHEIVIEQGQQLNHHTAKTSLPG